MSEVGEPSGCQMEWEILREIARGRLERFDLIVDRYKGKLLRFIAQRVGDSHLAEDLAQEVFLRIFRSSSGRGAFAGESSVGTWIFTIARNLVADTLRSRARKSLVLESELPKEDALRIDPPDPGSVEAPIRKLLREEEGLRIRHALRRLPEPQAEVLALKAFGDLTLSEISQVTGCPLPTVKSRLRYALERIRQALSGLRTEETHE